MSIEDKRGVMKLNLCYRKDGQVHRQEWKVNVNDNFPFESSIQFLWPSREAIEKNDGSDYIYMWLTGEVFKIVVCSQCGEKFSAPSDYDDGICTSCTSNILTDLTP